MAVANPLSTGRYLIFHPVWILYFRKIITYIYSQRITHRVHIIGQILTGGGGGT